MPTCPNGHQSGSDDWCEVCGHRMAGAVPPPPPPPPAYGYPQPDQGGYGGQDATAQAELCPQCRTPREALAPFCEECRWNFLTHQATYPQQNAPQPPYGGQQQRDPYEYQGSRPSQMNRPAEPFQQQQAPYQQEYQQQPQHTGGAGDDDWMLPPPSQQGQQGGYQQGQQHQGGYPQQGQQGGYQGDYQQGPQQGHPQQGGGQWSATVGPDRDYFMAMMQRSGPEAGGLNLPAYSPEQQLQLTGNQITIGRRRHSTGESPDVDLAVPPEDPGVSHQHAVLVQQPDGTWAVVDQNSTNGTTINGGEDPIQPYVPMPLQDGDRVHVGAWTTITIHRG
ncbi:FHA domain-containing protein [Streptomyces sp. NPDC058657]|uniref:FHA domain-containing protein n=1 Tax=unclassified Streptomyces TaxID=2593676 RepID=UPI003655ED15